MSQESDNDESVGDDNDEETSDEKIDRNLDTVGFKICKYGTSGFPTNDIFFDDENPGIMGHLVGTRCWFIGCEEPGQLNTVMVYMNAEKFDEGPFKGENIRNREYLAKVKLEKEAHDVTDKNRILTSGTFHHVFDPSIIPSIRYAVFGDRGGYLHIVEVDQRQEVTVFEQAHKTNLIKQVTSIPQTNQLLTVCKDFVRLFQFNAEHYDSPDTIPLVTPTHIFSFSSGKNSLGNVNRVTAHNFSTEEDENGDEYEVLTSILVSTNKGIVYDVPIADNSENPENIIKRKYTPSRPPRVAISLKKGKIDYLAPVLDQETHILVKSQNTAYIFKKTENTEDEGEFEDGDEENEDDSTIYNKVASCVLRKNLNGFDFLTSHSEYIVFLGAFENHVFVWKLSLDQNDRIVIERNFSEIDQDLREPSQASLFGTTCGNVVTTVPRFSKNARFIVCGTDVGHLLKWDELQEERKEMVELINEAENERAAIQAKYKKRLKSLVDNHIEKLKTMKSVIDE